MKVHSTELLEMCRGHFNEPMISGERVVRCIGYGETGVDCYIITQAMGGQVVWNSCVGGYVWLDTLKGQGYVRSTSGDDWDDLFRLDNVLALNGAPKAPEFLVDLRHEDMEMQEFASQRIGNRMDVPTKPEITVEMSGDRLTINANVDLEGLQKLSRMLDMFEQVLGAGPSLADRLRSLNEEAKRIGE